MATIAPSIGQRTLAQMAAELKQALATVKRGYVHRTLFGGLHLGLERNDCTWRLALARERSYPSQSEQVVVARDFHLPAGVVWATCEKIAQGRTFKPGTKLWVVECRWMEPGGGEP